LNKQLKKFLVDFDLNEPADRASIHAVEEQLNFKFPEEYLNFLLFADGGEGSIGEVYLNLWRVEELIEDNEGYNVDEFAPGLLIIGSDGGDTAFCIDTRSPEKPFVSIPFIGMDLDEIEKISNDFTGFIKSLYFSY